MKTCLPILAASLTLSRSAFSQLPDEKPLTPEQVKFFESKIRPLFAEYCYKCHSERFGKFKGGLALDTREGVRQGR